MPKRTTFGSEFGDLFRSVREGIAEKKEQESAAKQRATDHAPASAPLEQGRGDRPTRHDKKQKHKKPRKGPTPNHGDLSIYGRSAPARSAPVASPVLSVSDVSADMRRIVIQAPRASSLQRISRRIKEADSSEQAILGLDFGTAFTKAVISWRRRYYVVKWSDTVDCEDPHLLPSTFSRASDGQVALGIVNGWRQVDGIKMGLLQAGPTRAPAAEMDAVIFVALVIQHAHDWFEAAVHDQRAHRPEWRLNIGLPAVPWQNPAMRETWRRVAACAWALSERPISRATAVAEFGRVHNNARVGVVPEFAAQIAPYLRSPQRQHDLHGLLDVGAGTVDVVAFNSHWDQSGDVLPIFGALVEPLGVHHLIGALAGKAGEEIGWQDGDARLGDRDVAEKTGESVEAVAGRRAIFQRELKAVVRQIIGIAKHRYRTSPIWRSRSGFPFFLCGGGAANLCLETSLKTVEGYALSLRKLPCPDSVMGEVDDTNFHRISVAYGLSQLTKNIGRIVPSDQIPPDPPPRVIERKDRDEDR